MRGHSLDPFLSRHNLWFWLSSSFCLLHILWSGIVVGVLFLHDSPAKNAWDSRRGACRVRRSQWAARPWPTAVKTLSGLEPTRPSSRIERVAQGLSHMASVCAVCVFSSPSFSCAIRLHQRPIGDWPSSVHHQRPFCPIHRCSNKSFVDHVDWTCPSQSINPPILFSSPPSPPSPLPVWCCHAQMCIPAFRLTSRPLSSCLSALQVLARR